MSIAALLFGVLAVGLIGASAWLLQMARGREHGEEVLQRLRAEGTSREETELPAAENPRLRDPVSRWLGPLLWRAGWEVSTPQTLLGALVLLLLAVFAFALGGFLVGTLGTGGVIALAYGLLLRLGARRRQRIVDQLPNFLENVIRVLAAGNSLEESFAAAAREAPEPIRPLFLSVSRQVRLGAPIDQVLTEAGTLYRLRDLRVLGLAASVNRRYGGSIRNVLKSLITAVRQRNIAARELRALTAETRFSAVVLAVVPIGLSIFIFTSNTQYYIDMWHQTAGRAVLLVALGMQVAGTVALWLMLRATEGAEA